VSGPALRRALHAASATVALLTLISPAALRLGTAYLAATMLALEAARLRSDAVAGVLRRVIPVYRDRERRRPSGALWLLLAYAACAWFPHPAALAGILVGGLADPAGAVVGTRFGRGTGKSAPGSAAVAGVAMLVALAIGVPVLVAAVAAAAAAMAERWSGPVDDNLAVGPVTAAVVAALA
jgi:dolichol kinase